MIDRARLHDERGAMLVHVAVIFVALMAFTALVFDYGVLYAGRRQAQNSADAAALAAGISLSFVDSTNQTLARNSALGAAQENEVWGEVPDILPADVTFPPCPPGAPGVPDTCVRANVFRTSYERDGATSPLPTFFANLVGVGEQGVRATATAQMLAGAGTSDCVKPLAVPDRWNELRPTPSTWTVGSEFERYQQIGPNQGALLDPADDYIPPDPAPIGDPGSGYSLPEAYGLRLRLYVGDPRGTITPGWFYPVVLDPGCVGPNCYRDAIETCTDIAVGPGTVLQPEPGAVVDSTRQGVSTLIAQDPAASWSPTANGGRGAPVGGCMAAGTCGRSPRLIAIAVFDVAAYDLARINEGTGRTLPINIIKVLGFWLEGLQGNDVVGYITHYPTTSISGLPMPGTSSFTRTVILVR